MIRYFDPLEDLIRIGVQVSGPSANGSLRFVIDTGASRTVIKSAVLLRLGYPLADQERAFESISTATRIESVPVIRLLSLTALGQTRVNLRVLAASLPADIETDGLLGLDFFRNTRLLLDFQKGRLRLT